MSNSAPDCTLRAQTVLSTQYKENGCRDQRERMTAKWLFKKQASCLAQEDHDMASVFRRHESVTLGGSRGAGCSAKFACVHGVPSSLQNSTTSDGSLDGDPAFAHSSSSSVSPRTDYSTPNGSALGGTKQGNGHE